MREQQTSNWSSTPAAEPINTHLAFAKHHADTRNGLHVHTYHHYCSLHSDLHLQTLNLAASKSNHRHSTNPVVDEVCVQKICRSAKMLPEAEVGITFSQKGIYRVSKPTMVLIHKHASSSTDSRRTVLHSALPHMSKRCNPHIQRTQPRDKHSHKTLLNTSI